MRIAESLTLPPELERARAAGELVVFAGAGVSMGPPAYLPDFKGLARTIAESAIGWEDRFAESLDQYLGDAERRGVLVEARARALLKQGGSHTPLHEHLVGIFGAPEQVRLVTTNFDEHFTTAAEQVFSGRLVPHYVGPALPPGRDFRGIVQLHGSLANPQDRLVLTDRDFAAAYMAEGWAARFLVGVFASRTVLFVGYSLSDPVMQYLMRALPPTGRWYALWHESETSLRRDHAIVAVPFRTSPTGERFRDLAEGLRRWHWYAQASPSDHDRELRRLIASGPPTSPEDADYLRTRLATEAGRVGFWTAATDEAWFDWAASQGYLDGIADATRADPDTVRWGRWCLSHFCQGASPPFLRFLRGRPLTLHPGVLVDLLVHLWRLPSLPPRSVLRQLVALIANQTLTLVQDVDSGVRLLERLVRESCWDEAIAILRCMTRLHLQPVERLYLALEEVEAPSNLRPLANRVGIEARATDLAEFLDRQGPTLAAAVGGELLRLAEQRIGEAYDLLDLARGPDEGMDWLSFGRTAITPTDQDHDSHAEDVLIGIARIALDHLSDAAPGNAVAFAERNDHSRRKLLRRLALYAHAKSSTLEPDDLLGRAVTGGWASDMWVRPELYLVLRAYYGRASEPARATFVASLVGGAEPTKEADGEAAEDHEAHVRFSLSRMLLRTAPDSLVTQAFAAAETADHPEWIESDADGYLSRVDVGWGGEEPSPIEADQMLSWQPGDAVARLREALDEAQRDRTQDALLGALQHAVRSNAAWGTELLLRVADTMPSDGVLEAILSALRDASLDPDAQLTVLRTVAGGSWPRMTVKPLAQLLKKWSDDLPDSPDVELLDALDVAADLAYQWSREEPTESSEHGWTERAWNHPAYHAALVWWRVADVRDRFEGQFVLSVDDAERTRWAGVVVDDSPGGAAARPILGMVTDRLSSADFPWAAQVIFPGFDTLVNAERAAQLWDGRLKQQRWQWSTLDGLRPYWEGLLAASASLVPARSRALGDWVAMLIASTERTRLTLTQLHSFIRHATPDAREAFARAVPRHVAKLSPDARRKLWNELLAPYWRDRRTNVPLRLAPEEVREMIAWVMAMPEVAPAALAELEGSPAEGLERADDLLRRWRGDYAWVRAHPTEAVGVVAFLARARAINPWTSGDAVIVLERALEAGASGERVMLAAEPLVALSEPGAAALIERLRSGGDHRQQ